MEKAEDKSEKNDLFNGITKKVNATLGNWAEHITDIDISNKNIKTIEDNIKFPPNVYYLNLSHNILFEVPNVILNLDKLKNLDLSNNSITYFDDKPSFCHTIETINLAYNNLCGLPYWIWADNPERLGELNLSNNIKITESMSRLYFQDIMKHSVGLTTVKIVNCRLGNYVQILSTFTKVKSLEVGHYNISSFCNRLEEIPCKGLDKCGDVEKLNLSNTQIYNIRQNIDIFKHLVEINLSMNHIGDLPPEFCNLEKLEVCNLSCNNLLYLPEDIYKLKKLIRLHIDYNQLCMLPESIVELKNLQYVDLYNNGLYEVPKEVLNVKELDLAQNFFDEPEDQEYLQKKDKLRINIMDRYNGRKVVPVKPESEYSPCSSYDDDEEYLKSKEENGSKGPQEYEPPSSPEDWDCDEYWVPCVRPVCTSPPPPLSRWMYYVKQKMAEGNFCPMDAHTVPIEELVKYENNCNPKEWVEVEGQFDDLSDDNS